jgi:hypothetical protein
MFPNVDLWIRLVVEHKLLLLLTDDRFGTGRIKVISSIDR